MNDLFSKNTGTALLDCIQKGTFWFARWQNEQAIANMQALREFFNFFVE